jgi:hypothetical protein
MEMQLNITSSQIQAFAQTLVNNGIIDKSDIELCHDLIEEALKISQSRDGLAIPLESNNQVQSTSLFVRERSIDSAGRQIYKHIYDPVEIFSKLYVCKQNEQERAMQEQRQRIEREYWAFCNIYSSASERKHPIIGEINLQYFLDNPYKCPSGSRCPFRFATQEEADKHKWQHCAG